MFKRHLGFENFSAKKYLASTWLKLSLHITTQTLGLSDLNDSLNLGRIGVEGKEARETSNEYLFLKSKFCHYFLNVSPRKS